MMESYEIDFREQQTGTRPSLEEGKSMTDIGNIKNSGLFKNSLMRV
jgi:hypothetical protein